MMPHHPDEGSSLGARLFEMQTSKLSLPAADDRPTIIGWLYRAAAILLAAFTGASAIESLLMYMGTMDPVTIGWMATGLVSLSVPTTSNHVWTIARIAVPTIGAVLIQTFL